MKHDLNKPRRWVIEKGVPLKNDGKKDHYPWDLMKVGDSFVVPGVKSNGIRSAASLAGKRRGMEFTIRKMEDGSLRCWRIR